MRSIFFDVDGVLIHGFHAKPEKRRRWDIALLADLGVDPEGFSAGFIPGAFLHDVLPGRRSLVDAVGEWLLENGHKISPLQFIAYWLTRDSQLNHELLAIITRLRGTASCKLYIATNQEHLRAMHLWSALGLHQLFDDMFYAARIGVIKPDPAFFSAIDRIIGPQTEPPLLFDDSEHVIEGARQH